LSRFDQFFSDLAKKLKASEIRELLKWVRGKNVISFGGGFPSPELYPVKELAEIAKRIIEEKKHVALQYTLTEGLPELRSALKEFMERKDGIKVESEDNILITSGSQQALDIIGRLFINPGDAVIMELPTYLAAINAFNLQSPRYYGVPIDYEGIIVEKLEELLTKLKSEGVKPKFLYTVPTAQNPTGITMTMERRKRLLELAEEYDFLIIEDNPYGYILFENMEIKHLKALDKSERVIYLSTFSKVLVPGLRLGWVIADKEIISKMALLKQSLDLCSSTITQFIAYEAIVSGLVDKQIKILPGFYKKKRDAMLNALEKYMPDGVEWTKPIGGMFVFLYAPEQIDTHKMLFKAIDRGVAYVPGKNFYIDGSGHNTMRLNFSYPSLDDIDRGIKILADLLREEIEKTKA